MSRVYMQALSPVFAQEEGEIIIAREYDAEYDRAWLRLFRQVSWVSRVTNTAESHRTMLHISE